MEDIYIKFPKKEEYRKQIDFMKNPVKFFKEEAKSLRKVYIDEKIEIVLFEDYKRKLKKNLIDF